MYVINRNSHSIYVPNPDDQNLFPIAAGALAEADGELLDALVATDGVDTPSSKEVSEWESRHDAAASADLTPDMVRAEAVREARRAAHAFLAATNSLVIGDDQSPHGPPSGTIKTKQELAKTDPEHFAENEAITVGTVGGGIKGSVGGATPLSSVDVHNAQVEAEEAASEAASALLKLQQETVEERQRIDAGEPEDEDLEEQPEADGETAPADPYEDLNGEQLKDELRERDLPVSGTVDELRDRLRSSDAENDETV